MSTGTTCTNAVAIALANKLCIWVYLKPKPKWFRHWPTYDQTTTTHLLPDDDVILLPYCRRTCRCVFSLWTLNSPAPLLATRVAHVYNCVSTMMTKLKMHTSHTIRINLYVCECISCERSAGAQEDIVSCLADGSWRAALLFEFIREKFKFHRNKKKLKVRS